LRLGPDELLGIALAALVLPAKALLLDPRRGWCRAKARTINEIMVLGMGPSDASVLI
jgi:hypothetical protein